MSLSDFDSELKTTIRDGVIALFGWIHSNPSATAAQAKFVIKSWLDSNAPDYATQSFGDRLVGRLFSYADGTWIGFRSKVLTYHDFLGAIVIDSLLSNRPLSSAGALREWLLDNGGGETIERNGPKNWVSKTTLTDGTYTVEKIDNPTEAGRFIESNPGQWSEI